MIHPLFAPELLAPGLSAGFHIANMNTLCNAPQPPYRFPGLSRPTGTICAIAPKPFLLWILLVAFDVG